MPARLSIGGRNDAPSGRDGAAGKAPTGASPTASIKSGWRLALSGVVVFASMAALFLLPHEYFIPVAFVATACMVAGAAAVGGYRRLFAPRYRTMLLGCATAALLYATFWVGNLLIQQMHPLGISTSNESSIYGLISSPTTPVGLQLGVLIFDAVGYESFFRGVLQKRMLPRLGLAAPFATAGVDAVVHVLSFNPLWVVTTFIVDSVWGLTYYYARDLSASIASHFVWDVAIFLIFPIG